MTPSYWDHAFVLLLLTAIPLYGRFEHRRLVKRLTAGGFASKVELYRTSMLAQWVLAAALLTLWWAHGRSASALGITLRADDGAALGAVVVAAGLAVLALQRFLVRRLDASGRRRLRAQFAGTRALLPEDDREHRWFRAMAVTAGVCEELLYRGFLIPYCAHFAGAPLGILLAAGLFGLGHLYQGPRGVAKTFLVGVAAGLLYVETGSLLWPMLLHAALDLQGGALGRRVMADPDDPTEQD